MSLPYAAATGSHLQAPNEDISGNIIAPRRTSNVSGRRLTFRDNIRPQDLESLTRTASAISGHHDAYTEAEAKAEQPPVHTPISYPKAAKPGPISTIRELPSEFNTPYSTRPPSPASGNTPSPNQNRDYFNLQVENAPSVAGTYPDIGTVKSLRGALILIITCGSQLLDNVFMTGVNISLPAIQKEFGVPSGDLQWLISAYTLTFGGFMLLAGVLSDRFGRKLIFCIGMLWISVWTLAAGFVSSFIQLAIFRALQGIGAAMTVPSSVGIISSYYVAKDRTIALSFFAAAGAVGFACGLIFGGFLTSSLGWRYLFYVTVTITSTLGAMGWALLPKDRLEGLEKPRLDFVGAGLSTAGLILLSFVLSSGGVYGWNKAFIIVLLIVSVAALCIFTYIEKKVSHPIMPLSLWKIQNFAALWISGFFVYGGYQTVLYYIVLIAQEINDLSSGATALRFLPMGFTGFIFCMMMGRIIERFNTKKVLLVGMVMMACAPIPSSLIKEGNINFWTHVFPTSVLVVAAVTIVYCSCTIILLSSVPLNVKSLCGGMINTAFQIGSGVGLALSSAVVQAVDTNKGHSAIEQYSTGLWCCVAFGGVGFFASLFGIKNINAKPHGGGVIAVH